MEKESFTSKNICRICCVCGKCRKLNLDKSMRNMSFPGSTVVKNPPANAGNSAEAAGLIPGYRRSHGEGNGNPVNQVFLPGKS